MGLDLYNHFNQDPILSVFQVRESQRILIMNYYQVQLKNAVTGRYVCAKVDSSEVTLSSLSPADSETFHLRKIDQRRFLFQSRNMKVFLRIDSHEISYVGMATGWEGPNCNGFEIIRTKNDSNRVRILASNGSFVRAFKEGDDTILSADFPAPKKWDVDDESVFLMTIIGAKEKAVAPSNSITNILSSIRPMDGFEVRVYSSAVRKYLCAERGGVAAVVATRSKGSFWLWGVPETDKYLIQVPNEQYMGLDDQQNVVGTSNMPGRLEAFEIEQMDNDDKYIRVRIKAPNGFFLQAKGAWFTADGKKPTNWEINNPSVFLITIQSTTIPKGPTVNAIEGAGKLIIDELTNTPSQTLIQVQFKSLIHKEFIGVWDWETGGTNYRSLGFSLNQSKPPSDTETFNLRKISETKFILGAYDGKFVGVYREEEYLVNAKYPVVYSRSAEKYEAFEIMTAADNSNRVRIKTPNGTYLQTFRNGWVYITAEDKRWDADDETVFFMTIVGTVEPFNKGMPPSIADILANIRPLDGVKGQLKSVVLNKYLSAKSGGWNSIVANRSEASYWETFELWSIPGTNKYLFQAFGGQFIGLEGEKNNAGLVAISRSPGRLEAFEIVRMGRDFNRVRIKAANGFLQALTEATVTAGGTESTNWRDNDPSVFLLTIFSTTIPKSTTTAIEAAGQNLAKEEMNSWPTGPSTCDLPITEFLTPIQVQFKSLKHDAYIGVRDWERDETNYRTLGFAPDKTPSERETFNLQKISETKFLLVAYDGRFVGVYRNEDALENAKYPVVNSRAADQYEAFEIMTEGYNSNLVRIRGPNGKFLEANKNGWVYISVECDDESVFLMTIARPVQPLNKGMAPSNENILANIRPLDGVKAHFKSVALNKYLSAEVGGQKAIFANQSEAVYWETFELWSIPGTNKFLFQVFSGQFMGLEGRQTGAGLMAISNSPGILEAFEIVQMDGDFNRVRIKAAFGFLQAKTEASITANGKESTDWGDADPSVFMLTIVDVSLHRDTAKAIEGARQLITDV